MKVKFFYIIIAVFSILTVNSCSTDKTILFEPSNEMTVVRAYNAQKNHIPVFQKNDVIKITLISSNEKFSKLFSEATENNVRNQLTYTSGAAAQKGFLVNQDGYIDIPFTGRILVHNRNREEVRKEITEKLKKYINEPIIQLNILNFKITVLGDVQRPGTFNIPNEKVSFVEALGIAGDLNITANMTDVRIFREHNDSLETSQINLNSDDIFYSNFYMLQQNDVIYIPPNKAKSRSAKYSSIYIPLLTSVSLLLTTLNLLR